MRMRGFREVRGELRDCGYYGEKPNSQSENNYKKIKPESDITIEECNAFWDNLFAGKIESLPDEIIMPDGTEELPDEISLEDLK